MGLVSRYWNGNKRGPDGTYPWRAKQLKPDGRGYLGGDYLGHNIACIAVNSRGQIIDFDFNHNEIFSSSVEHAESRLVRRVFSLTQIYELATTAVSTTIVPINYANVLNDVTIYTSLESCSQCSGIMALGSVKEVVFLQRDPGQNSIGNILRNLSPAGGRYLPPLPIPADVLGLAAFTDLDAAYRAFRAGVDSSPFHVPVKGPPDKSESITSFLCTDAALDVFTRGNGAFAEMKLECPDYPFGASHGEPPPGTMKNAEALENARRFYDYAVVSGRRGTPHVL
jgi:tRNA(Arg) A34 adenosine deaminase TadA